MPRALYLTWPGPGDCFSGTVTRPHSTHLRTPGTSTIQDDPPTFCRCSAPENSVLCLRLQPILQALRLHRAGSADALGEAHLLLSVVRVSEAIVCWLLRIPQVGVVLQAATLQSPDFRLAEDSPHSTPASRAARY